MRPNNSLQRTRQTHFKEVCEGRAKIHRLSKRHGVVWADSAVEQADEVKAMVEAAQQDMETKVVGASSGSEAA